MKLQDYDTDTLIAELRMRGLAVDTWQPEDVEWQAEQMGVSMTREECREVLDLIDAKANAEVGINWDVIATYIHNYVKEQDDERIKNNIKGN